jgi:hypothetical protein
MGVIVNHRPIRSFLFVRSWLLLSSPFEKSRIDENEVPNTTWALFPVFIVRARLSCAWCRTFWQYLGALGGFAGNPVALFKASNFDGVVGVSLWKF